MKANATLSWKVFQITEDNVAPDSYRIQRKHSFENRSTRKHYACMHQIVIIANGVEMATASLDLKAPPSA